MLALEQVPLVPRKRTGKIARNETGKFISAKIRPPAPLVGGSSHNSEIVDKDPDYLLRNLH